MKYLRFLKVILVIAVLGGLGTAGYVTRNQWLPYFQRDAPEVAEDSTSSSSEESASIKKIILTDQAIANLRLSVQSEQPQTYWRTIQVPGMIVDRPGRSDRGVISPVTGVVTEIHFFPGDTVRPDEKLFTIRLLSESLHETQSELFKATQDIKLAKAHQKRLSQAVGAIPESRIIEVNNQITRLEVAVKAYRRELFNRGLRPQQIDEAAEGDFVNEITVVVPPPPTDVKPLTTAPSVIQSGGATTERRQLTFEVQELKTDVGQQVKAGQTLCVLANHQMLSIEGRAFRDETLLLERSVKERWPVDIDFQENAEANWPAIEQAFQIRHIANTIDPVNRTFGFLIPLENQSREVKDGDRIQILWRFRPGQKLRVSIRIEKLDNVFVLPTDAVARELAEAFVFTQNVNTFERKPVRIVAEDRQHTVIANDGSLIPGAFVVQNAAAQLNRMTKSKSESGLPEGYHMHADGSLHKNEDEGK